MEKYKKPAAEFCAALCIKFPEILAINITSM